MKLWLVALLLTISVPAMAPTATAGCTYYDTVTVETPVAWNDDFVRAQRYRCDGNIPGYYQFTQRVDILRIGEGDPYNAHAIIAQLEIQSIQKRFPDGHEEEEHFVALSDSRGAIGYWEAEYADSTSLNGACSGRASTYRGSPTTRTATATLPACVPTLGLLP